MFDDYGEDYDKHVKKLMYSAPRIIRSELAKIYKEKYEAEMTKRQEKNMLYTPPSYLAYMEKSLDILDLGCGTGLVGKWMKDYARHLVGVDLSDEMVNKARSKMLYTDLSVSSIQSYLENSQSNGAVYDVVVAADVFQYIGDLKEVIKQVCTIRILYCCDIEHFKYK